MLPATRLLMDALREEETGAPVVSGYEDVARVPRDDPRILTLQMKRKHQMSLIRKMMQDAGYADLARQTNFRTETLEDDQ
jgi:hypothetical protein